MTTLKVDYRTGGDPRDNMSGDELATVRALELDKLRRVVAQQNHGQKDFDESLHPRDDHGRFTDGSGSGDSGTSSGSTEARVSLPSTVPEVHSLYISDFNAYLKEMEDHGGPSDLGKPEEVYKAMNVAKGNETQPTEAQRAICEEAAAKFLNDPSMQPLFDEYGKPGIVIATGLVTTAPTGLDALQNDARFPGSDPADSGVVAQWSNGTIIMYADMAGDPNQNATPGFSIAGADPNVALMHEYGHQIMGVIGYDSKGDASDFRQSFMEAIGGGIPLGEHMSPAEQSDFQANVDINAGSISEYATTSPDECFAECFAELQQNRGNPNFSIDDSYDGGAAEALRIVRDRIESDVGRPLGFDAGASTGGETQPSPDQSALFNRTGQ